MPEKNIVKYGLKNVVVWPLTIDEENEAKYGAPIKIPGAVNLGLEAQGDTTPFHADNRPYYVTVANNGYEGDLEIALVPDEFAEKILNEIKDSNGVMLEVNNAKTQAFAIAFQFEGDANEILHLMYNCTVTRPGVESETTSDNREPKTDKLSLTASPLPNGRVKVRSTDETPVAVRKEWFDTPYIPPAEDEDETP